MTKKLYNESTQDVGVNIFIKLHSIIPSMCKAYRPCFVWEW